MRAFRPTSSFRAWRYATRGIPHGRKIIDLIKSKTKTALAAVKTSGKHRKNYLPIIPVLSYKILLAEIRGNLRHFRLPIRLERATAVAASVFSRGYPSVFSS